MVESGQYQRGRTTRGRLPEWFTRRPRAVRGGEVYLVAYARLSTERRYFADRVGPIPWSAIDSYGRRSGFRGIMLEHFVDVVMQLDRKHREITAERAEKDAAQAERRQKRIERASSRRGRLGVSRRRW